jgi:hypothetical protein
MFNIAFEEEDYCGNMLHTFNGNGILQHSETKSDDYHLSTAFYLWYLYRKRPKPLLPPQTLPQWYFANHASDPPRANPVNYVNNDDNSTNNNNVDANEAVVAEAGETNVANDDVNTNNSNQVVEFRVAKLADKQPHLLLQRTLLQQNPFNQAADPPRDVTMNMEKSLTQIFGDDELFWKTAQIDKNAGNDEVAESDDANNVIDKNNSNFNDAEANKGNVAIHAIESALLIEDNEADKSHASLVATHAIESSISTEANMIDHEQVAERQGSKSLRLANSSPRAIPVNRVNNEDNDANNNNVDSNEAIVAEAG